MRHRVKKDFILGGTLLAIGDKVFLEPYVSGGSWAVYSFFTRQKIGDIGEERREEYLTETPDDTTFPTERPKTKSGYKKYIKGFIILLFMSLGAKAQEEHVKWSWESVKVDSNVYMIRIEAWVEPGWYIPELNKLPDCNDLSPLLIDLRHGRTYKELESFSIVMATHKGMDKSCKVNFYDEDVIYTCPIKKLADSITVKGIIVYQAFNYSQRNSLAPPRSKEFTITIH